MILIKRDHKFSSDLKKNVAVWIKSHSISLGDIYKEQTFLHLQKKRVDEHTGL